jgi:mersacidin/lichenicidin family type 2 lantibiotic
MSTRRKFVARLFSAVGLGLIGRNAAARAQLTPDEIIKAWTNPEYRNNLTEEQWESLPKNPAGDITSGEFQGDFQIASGNNCSGNNCSGNNCSGNNCSGNNCSGDNCSGNNCSGNNCSGNNCSGNNCSQGNYC